MDGAIDWVVFVYDEELVLQSLSALMSLARETCEAEFAQSGDEEIEERGEHVSVVIADYIMPAMKGDALLVEVHRRWPLVRTIMLTGQSDMPGVARAINEGNLFRFIEKPFDNRDIILTIRAAREACLHEIELADKNVRLANLNAQLEAANQNLVSEVAPGQHRSEHRADRRRRWPGAGSGTAARGHPSRGRACQVDGQPVSRVAADGGRHVPADAFPGRRRRCPNETPFVGEGR